MKPLTCACFVAALLALGAVARPSSIAITDLDPSGSQGYMSGLGADFDVVNPTGIEVTALGYFDHLRDGITSATTIHVSIYDRTGSGSELLRLGFDLADPGLLEAGTSNRFKDLVSPLHLDPGEYSVVAIGFNLVDHNANTVHGNSPPTTDDGGGLLDLTGMLTRYGGALGTLPTNTGFYGPTYAFGAGTFEFEASVDTSAVPEPGTLLLFGLGLMGVGVCVRRRRSR